MNSTATRLLLVALIVLAFLAMAAPFAYPA
jgi:hypothetical protein